MTNSVEKIVKWLPLAMVVAAIIASASVSQFQIGANAEELKEVSEKADENEEDIEEIQRVLIQRQGEVELKVQRIEQRQQRQGADIKEVLRLLRTGER